VSIYDYKQSIEIAQHGYWFHALLFALIRKADTGNLARLKSVFPAEVAEMQQRYNAPGGALDDKEMEWVKQQAMSVMDEEM